MTMKATPTAHSVASEPRDALCSTSFQPFGARRCRILLADADAKRKFPP